MKKQGALGFTDVSSMFFATLLLRAGSVAGIILTLPVRGSLPVSMFEWFQRISYPLLFGNLGLLVFHKKIAAFLQRRPFVLLADLFLAAGILQIGGGWRSSYFEYTLTTIMLFTIFGGRRGAWLSAAVLSAAGLFKDPSGGLPSVALFGVDNWDMRIGAALFYITAGLIFGYFSTLLTKLDALSTAEVERAAMEAKTRLALELHDGAKQMVGAMLLKMNPFVKKMQSAQHETAEAVRWLWRGMNYLKTDLDQVMNTFKEGGQTGSSAVNILSIIKEEVALAEVMTGFRWEVTAETLERTVPHRAQLPLRRFLSEAMMNAWKHSGEMSGSITLKSAMSRAVITVADKGRGFEPGNTTERTTSGLKSLNYRAKELSAELMIETGPETGCTLILTLPHTR